MSEKLRIINLSDTQYDFLERSVKMWKEEKNYKLRNNIMFGVISEIEYILKSHNKD